MFVKKLEKLPDDLRKVLKVCSTLAHSGGYRIYLVGGIVRDILLRRENYDLDIVIEGDGIQFARMLAGRFNAGFCKHHAFGTATVHAKNFKIDVATARCESYEHWGALPGVRPALLKHDLFRRDFSVNAMAVSLNRDDYGALIDFYNGFCDLKQRRIRVLHDNSFLDDPTRIFRAIRFEQRFGFSLEPHTRKLLKEAVKAEALTLVNEHRVRDEMILILKEERPYPCLHRIHALVGFSFIYPHLTLKKEDFSLLRRIRTALGRYGRQFPSGRGVEQWIVYFMALIYRLPERARHVFISRYGFRKSEKVLFGSLRERSERVKGLCGAGVSAAAVYDILKPLTGEEIVFFYALYTDRRLRSRIVFFLERLSHIRLQVQGRDLKKMKVSPESSYGRILQELLYRKIEKGFTARREEMKELKRLLESGGRR